MLEFCNDNVDKHDIYSGIGKNISTINIGGFCVWWTADTVQEGIEKLHCARRDGLYACKLCDIYQMEH